MTNNNASYIHRMAKPCIWIREFVCKTCGERHKCEGKRGSLDEAQKQVESECRKVSRA